MRATHSGLLTKSKQGGRLRGSRMLWKNAHFESSPLPTWVGVERPMSETVPMSLGGTYLVQKDYAGAASSCTPFDFTSLRSNAYCDRAPSGRDFPTRFGFGRRPV